MLALSMTLKSASQTKALSIDSAQAKSTNNGVMKISKKCMPSDDIDSEGGACKHCLLRKQKQKQKNIDSQSLGKIK